MHWTEHVHVCVHKWVTQEPPLSREFPLWPGKEPMTASWHWGPINDLRTPIAYLIPQHTTAVIRTNTEVDSVLSSFPHWAVIDPCLIECRYSDLVFTSEPWIDAHTAADIPSGQVRSTAEQRSRLGYSSITGCGYWRGTILIPNITSLQMEVVVKIYIVNEKKVIHVKLFLFI